MEKNNELVEYILGQCREGQITQSELARELGCTTRTVRYWKYGERGMSIDMADKALRMLGLTYMLGKQEGGKG